MVIDKHISRTFEILKLGAICLVFFGHFFAKTIPLVWIPVTTALIVFSFSSGYFTHLKYQDRFEFGGFWKKKLWRLGINLMVIDAFLLILFLVQGRADIWTWQTLVSCLGLNGFLSWFHISNASPFGQGMWFFTLLILFYLAYPGLRAIQSKWQLVFLIAFIGTAYFLSRVHDPGHALYLTAVGFVTGVYVGGGQTNFPFDQPVS